MSYAVSCPCGRQIAVSAVDAGRQVPCDCGRQVSVPSLGKLARAAGEPMRTLSASEKVRVLVAAGELPRGTTCVRCQFPTEGILDCSVECERPYRSERGFWDYLLLMAFGSWWLAAIAWRDYEQTEVHGRETLVKTPLRMCPDCQARYHAGSRAGELRQLLHSVPEYDALLQTFPNASVAAMVTMASHSG